MFLAPCRSIRPRWPPDSGLLSSPALMLLALCLLCACNREQEAYQPTYAEAPSSSISWYIFGVHPLHNPERLHDLYGPLADLLSASIPGARFRLEASRNYEAFDQKLYAGLFHLALPNPYQTVLSLKHGYRVFGKMRNDEDFRGIILVRKDSTIRKAADLKGKAMSFPAPTALAATLMPLAFLHSHGLDVVHDLDKRFVGSQESSIMNVYLGDVAAAATWPPPWRALSAQRPELREALEIRWQTPPLPNNGLVARQDVPPAVVEQVGRILFALHTNEAGAALLQRMEQTGFEAADDATYQPVRDFLASYNDHVQPIVH